MTTILVGASFVLFGALFLLRRGNRLPYALVGFYAFPLYLLTALSSEGYAPTDLQVSPALANIARIALHGAWLFLLGLLVLIIRRGRFRVPAVLVPAIASCAWLMLVVIVGDWAGVETTARVMLTLAAVASLFVLVPSLAGDGFLIHMGRATVVLAFVLSALSALTIWQYGNFPVWTMRFGRPLNPNVLAYLLLLALIAGNIARSSLIAQGIVLAALLATGSRACAALAVVFVLARVLHGRRRFAKALIGVPLLAAGLSGLIYLPGALDRNVQIYERSSLGSGRLEAWSEAATLVAQHPLLGEGERVSVEASAKSIRAHNLYIEMAASYGLPMAFLTLVLYAMLWFGTRLQPFAVRFYAFTMVVVPLVTTVSWMNLGDGAVIVSLATVVPLVPVFKKAV